MNKLFILIMAMGYPLLGFADQPTAPTKNSSPLPSLQQTQNMDTVQTEKIQKVIVNTPSLKGQSVTAAMNNGVVTLQGSVENKEQEKDAINAVKSIAGVRKVDSQLTIKQVGGHE